MPKKKKYRSRFDFRRLRFPGPLKAYQLVAAVLMMAIVFELSKHLNVKLELEIYGRNISVELRGAPI